jgi:NAD(P)H-nitrite reductase large subunit
MGCGGCRPEVKAILDAQVNIPKKEQVLIAV